MRVFIHKKDLSFRLPPAELSSQKSSVTPSYNLPLQEDFENPKKPLISQNVSDMPFNNEPQQYIQEQPLQENELSSDYSKFVQVDPTSTEEQETPLSRITTLQFSPGEIEHFIKLTLKGHEVQNLGLSWQGNPSLSIAFGSEDKISSNFSPIHVHSEGVTVSMDNVLSLSSELYTLDAGNTIYLRSDSAIKELEITIVNSLENDLGITTSGLPNHESGKSYSTLPILSRYEWSGVEDINNPSQFTWDPVYFPAKRFVIHHTATDENQNPVQAVRNIYSYHAYSKGWGDIAYNYLIDRNGTIYEGKAGGEETMGYGSGAFWGNREVIAIAVIGNYSDHLPSEAALNSLIKLVSEKSVLFNINLKWKPTNNNPDLVPTSQMGTMFGHRNYDNTACPGQVLYDYLPTLVSKSKSYATNHFETIRNVVLETNQLLDSSTITDNATLTIYTNSHYSSPGQAVPVFSGITSYQTFTDSVRITFSNYPEDWITENDPDVSKARMKTLYKLFAFDRGVNTQVMGNGVEYTTQ